MTREEEAFYVKWATYVLAVGIPALCIFDAGVKARERHYVNQEYGDAPCLDVQVTAGTVLESPLSGKNAIVIRKREAVKSKRDVVRAMSVREEESGWYVLTAPETQTWIASNLPRIEATSAGVNDYDDIDRCYEYADRVGLFAEERA